MSKFAQRGARASTAARPSNVGWKSPGPRVMIPLNDMGHIGSIRSNASLGVAVEKQSQRGSVMVKGGEKGGAASESLRASQRRADSAPKSVAARAFGGRDAEYPYAFVYAPRFMRTMPCRK